MAAVEFEWLVENSDKLPKVRIALMNTILKYKDVCGCKAIYNWKNIYIIHIYKIYYSHT